MANTYDKQAMKKFENEVAQLLEKGVPETEMREALLKAGCPEELIPKVISDAETIEEKDEGAIEIDFSRIFGGAKKTNAEPTKIKHYFALRFFGKVLHFIGWAIMIMGLIVIILIDETPLLDKGKVAIVVVLVALLFIAFGNIIDLQIDNTQANQSAANYLKQLAGKK